MSYDRIRICFSNLILGTLCEKKKKNNKGEAESIIFILVLVLTSFLSAKYFLKIWDNHFSFLTFESFKPSLSLFLTIEGKRQIDLSFSQSARFEQLNAAQKPDIFKFLFLFHFVIIFYCLSSRQLSFRPLFLIVLHNGVKNIHVKNAWFVTRIGTKNSEKHLPCQ